LLDVVLPLLLKLVELLVVLQGGLLKILALHLQLPLQLLNPPAIKFLNAGKFVFEPIVFEGQILVLMQEIIDLEVTLGKQHLLATVIVLQLDQLVLEFDPLLPLTVQIHLKTVLRLPELLPLTLQHELHLTQTRPVLIRSV
jgi:hypothetical protein